RPCQALADVVHDDDEGAVDRTGFDSHRAWAIRAVRVADDVRTGLVHSETDIRDRLIVHADRGGEVAECTPDPTEVLAPCWNRKLEFSDILHLARCPSWLSTTQPAGATNRSEQAVSVREASPEVLAARRGDDPPSRCPLEESELEQKRFVDVLD